MSAASVFNDLTYKKRIMAATTSFKREATEKSKFCASYMKQVVFEA